MKQYRNIILILTILGSGLCMAQTLDEELVGLWEFEDGATKPSTSVVTDTSGQNNHGTLMGQTGWAEFGYEGWAVNLNETGSGDWVEVPDSDTLSVPSEFSIFGWVKPYTLDGDVDAFFAKGTGATDWALGSWGLPTGAIIPRFEYNIGEPNDPNWKAPDAMSGSNFIFVPNLEFTLEEWHYYGVATDGKDMKFYINTNMDSRPQPNKIIYGQTSEPLTLGADLSAEDRWFDGLMDEVRFYNRMLSEGEVFELTGLMAKPFDPQPIDAAPAWGSPTLSWRPIAGTTGIKVYFGTDADNLEMIGNFDHAARNINLTHFVKGQDYVWRVDTITAEGTVTGDLWSFTMAQDLANTPQPLDGAKAIPPHGLSLAWLQGVGAVAHDVFFGTVKAQVFEADTHAPEYRGQVSETQFSITETLGNETWYYWRIDEVLADGSTTKGTVWSFQTIAEIANLDPNLVAWYRFDRGFGTEILDWAGGDNNGSLSNAAAWSPGGYEGWAMEFEGQTSHISAERMVENDMTIMAWIKTDRVSQNGGNSTQAFGGDAIFWSDVAGAQPDFVIAQTGSKLAWFNGQPDVTLHSDQDISTGEWIHIACTREIGSSDSTREIYINGVFEAIDSHNNTGPLNATNEFIIAGNALDGRYWYGMVDEVKIFNSARTEQQVQRDMVPDPRKPWAPSPIGSADRAEPVILTWSAGDDAQGHNVYFGNTEDTMALMSPNQKETKYTVGMLTPDETYFWQIGETQVGGGEVLGNVWSFTVSTFMFVEDFEDYDGNNKVWLTWDDSWVPGYNTGAQAGYDIEPFVETRRAFFGRQSLPLMFDNSGFWYSDRPTNAKHSEIRLVYPSPQDWTINDMKSLSIRFYGNGNNELMPTDKLYMGLEDTSGKLGVVFYDGDHRILAQEAWNEFIVPLADFGIDSTKIKTLYIGIGDRDNPVTGGQSPKPYTSPNFGILIDAIRLYPARCEPDKIDFPEDLNGDCVVDALDLNVLTEHWLAEGVLPRHPGNSGLVSHLPLDGNIEDVKGDMDGTSFFNSFVPGIEGQAADLENGGSITLNSSSLISNQGSITLSVWVQTRHTGGDWQRIFDFGNDNSAYLMLAAHRGNPANVQGLRFAINPTGDEGESQVNTQQPLTTNEWNQVTVVLDTTAEIARVFIDDVLAGENLTFNVTPSMIEGPTVQNYIGQSQYANDGLFQGLVDDLRIYNRAVDAGEVAGLAGKDDGVYRYEGDSGRCDLNNDGIVNEADKAMLEAAEGKTVLWP